MSSETESDGSVDGDHEDVDVDVNEEALEAEAERRTVKLEVPVDDIHATAVDQLESAGVPLEDVLAQRLRPTTEDAIHQILQEAKYSE
jgi:hypothetical protein